MKNQSVEEDWKVAKGNEGKLVKIDKPACSLTLEIQDKENYETTYEDYPIDSSKAGGILSDARKMLGRQVTLTLVDNIVMSISLS